MNSNKIEFTLNNITLSYELVKLPFAKIHREKNQPHQLRHKGQSQKLLEKELGTFGLLNPLLVRYDPKTGENWFLFDGEGRKTVIENFEGQVPIPCVIVSDQPDGSLSQSARRFLSVNIAQEKMTGRQKLVSLSYLDVDMGLRPEEKKVWIIGKKLKRWFTEQEVERIALKRKRFAPTWFEESEGWAMNLGVEHKDFFRWMVYCQPDPIVTLRELLDHYGEIESVKQAVTNNQKVTIVRSGDRASYKILHEPADEKSLFN